MARQPHAPRSRRTRLLLLAACTGLLLVASPVARGQDVPTPRRTLAEPAPPAVSAIPDMDGFAAISAAGLLGLEVGGPRGEGLGTVVDLVLDRLDERLVVVVLDRGDDRSPRRVAVPSRLLSLRRSEARLLAPFDAERLDRAVSAPEQTVVVGSWVRAVHARFGESAPPLRGGGAPVADEVPGARFVRVGQLLDRTVTVQTGGSGGLGRLVDVAVDLRSGGAPYAVLVRQPAGGGGFRRYAVSLRALVLLPDGALASNIDTSRLDQSAVLAAGLLPASPACVLDHPGRSR